MRRVVIGLLSLAVLAVLFVVLCTFVKRPYESVILNRFGNLVPDDHQTRIAGNWFLKWPTDSLIRMDTRIHLFTNPFQQIPTSGSETINVRTYAAWRIADPIKFYQTTQASDHKAEMLLGQKISGIVQAQIASHPLDELFNVDAKQVKTDQMEAAVAQDVSSAIAEQGLQIVQIGFSRIGFPPANADAVYTRMSTERQQAAQAYIAQGRADAARIRAQGTNDAMQTTSAAIKAQQTTEGEGDSQALDILASVQQTAAARDFYQYWKAMDVMKASFTKNTYLVLPTDTPWLTSLFSGGPANTSNNVAPPSTQPAPTVPTIGMSGTAEGAK